MFPKNNVWEQVKQHDKDLFADVDRRVGIQVCEQWSFLLTSNAFFNPKWRLEFKVVSIQYDQVS